jgi:hypothetical protein
VVGQAAVGEQMPVAGVQEQLCGLDCLGEPAGDVAPGLVWASICAGSTPSEKPA